MSYTNTEGLKNDNIILSFFKGLVIAMLLSFVFIILLAFSLKWFSLSDNVIVPVNLAIKILSTVIGGIIAIKGESRGLLKGVLFGALYSLSAFFCFSALAKTIIFDLSFVLDLVCTAVSGGLVGIIKVNKR